MERCWEGGVSDGIIAEMIPGVVMPSEVALMGRPSSGWERGVKLGGEGFVPRYSP